MQFVKNEGLDQVIKGSIALVIGIIGLWYIKNSPNPEPVYNPTIIQTSSLLIKDVDNNGTVDMIKGHKVGLYVNDTTLELQRANEWQFGLMLANMAYKPITPELQKVANKVLINPTNENTRNLEILLESNEVATH